MVVGTWYTILTQKWAEHVRFLLVRSPQPVKVVDFRSVPSQTVDVSGAVGCAMRCLIGQDDGAPSFSMRQFDVAPGGHTPKHQHPYEHEVFVLEGQGVVLQGDTEHPLQPGTVVFVEPNEIHQFRNTGSGPLRFLCLIPLPLRGLDPGCMTACGCE